MVLVPEKWQWNIPEIKLIELPRNRKKKNNHNNLQGESKPKGARSGHLDCYSQHVAVVKGTNSWRTQWQTWRLVGPFVEWQWDDCSNSDSESGSRANVVDVLPSVQQLSTMSTHLLGWLEPPEPLSPTHIHPSFFSTLKKKWPLSWWPRFLQRAGIVFLPKNRPQGS